MGRKDRAALRRIIVLLLALADLAQLACGRSRPVRWLVLSILGSGEVVARDYVAGLTGVPVSIGPAATLIDSENGVGDSVTQAMRLAFVFRALAATLAALPDDAGAPPLRPKLYAAGLAATFRDLMMALSVELRDSS